MAKTMQTPNPGSVDAIAMGCTCSELANHYGAKRPMGGWFVTLTCPLHTLDGNGGFMELPPVEVHRRNAAEARRRADQVDALADALEQAIASKTKSSRSKA